MRVSWLLVFAACTPTPARSSPVEANPLLPATPAAATAQPLLPQSPQSPQSPQAPPAPVAAMQPEPKTEPQPEPKTEPQPEGPCPKDMVDVGVACIDRYEAPNEKGKKPLLMQNADAGEAWCNARDKRLCRENEWVRACMGKRGYNYPYGAKYKLGQCNDDKTWKPPRWSALRAWPSKEADAEVARLDQAEPSGQREGCVSQDGVHDLTGNAAEWVVRTEDNDNNFAHVVKGCYWSRCFRPPYKPSCDYVNFAHPGTDRSYEMGFRCCRDRAD